MLILNPDTVLFGTAPWTAVRAVAIDRLTTRLVEEHGDEGPHVVFCDAPEQRITIRITQDLAESDLPGPVPGDARTLSVWTGPNRSQARRVRVQVPAVITEVRYLLPATDRTAAVARTITLAAVSDNSKTDPITVTPADTGPD